MSARWRCWTDMRMLDWDTVPLLDGTLLNERKLAVLDGRESATLDWGAVVLLDGRQLDERTLVKLDERMSAGLGYGGVGSWMGARC